MSAANDTYRFVLVDDEPRIHEFLVRSLGEHGLLASHTSYYDPVALMDHLQSSELEEEPDVILLDIHFEGSGLSGVDIIPFIREDYPYLPIVLLTGMDADAAREAQQYDYVYFVPKPVSPEQLANTLRFYVGSSRKSMEQLQRLRDELEDFRAYHKLLEDEIESYRSQTGVEAGAEAGAGTKADKPFERIREIVEGILKNSEILPSFVKDLQNAFVSNYELFKKVVEILVRFDVTDASNPGLNIHKVKGTDHVFSARLSRKVRLFFYLSPATGKRRLLRLDTVHDTKGMDRWLRQNEASYAD